MVKVWYEPPPYGPRTSLNRPSYGLVGDKGPRWVVQLSKMPQGRVIAGFLTAFSCIAYLPLCTYSIVLDELVRGVHCDSAKMFVSTCCTAEILRSSVQLYSVYSCGYYYFQSRISILVIVGDVIKPIFLRPFRLHHLPPFLNFNSTYITLM